MNDLERFIQTELSEGYPKQIDVLTRWVLERAVDRDGVCAVILYGSGLWQAGDNLEGVVWDLHVLVDQYSDFDDSLILAAAGSLLPHNVYYMQDESHEYKTILRCKFNVMRMNQFEDHAKGKSITPQIWARFCQPCRLIYARDEQSQIRVRSALANCVRTFINSALPLTDNQKKCHWKDVWLEGFRHTYLDEWRSEGKDRSDQILNASAQSFKKRLNLLFNDDRVEAYFIDDENIRIGFNPDHLKTQRLKRKVSRPLKKFVALMRLMKASFTFDNAMEYAAWKIERHSGHRVQLTQFQKKHAILGGAPLLFSLWRKGILK